MKPNKFMEKGLKNPAILVILLVFAPFVNADIAPEEGWHELNRCVKIVNLEDFPDITLIGYITGPMIDGYEVYVVESGECLTTTYKFDELRIYAVETDYLNSVGLEEIDFASDPNVMAYGEVIDVYGDYISDDDPLIEEEIEYAIAGFVDNGLVLYMSARTSRYNDGTPDVVEDFVGPDIPNIESGMGWEGFWDSFVCFFKGLFGNSC